MLFHASSLIRPTGLAGSRAQVGMGARELTPPRRSSALNAGIYGMLVGSPSEWGTGAPTVTCLPRRSSMRLPRLWRIVGTAIAWSAGFDFAAHHYTIRRAR